jgi:lipopolysaccharide export system permease protein
MRGTLLASLSWRFLKTLSAMLFAITAVAFLIDFCTFANRGSRLPAYSIPAGLTLSALHMPVTVEAVVPFIVQFASIALLSRLAQRRELVIFRSTGLSAFQIVAPLCAISLAFGILSVCVLDPLAAHSIALARSVEDRMGGAEAPPVLNDTPLWMANSEGDKLVVIGARKQRDGGLKLRDVTYLRFGSGAIAERIEATTAALVDRELVFTQANRFEDGRSGEQLKRLSIVSPFNEQAFRKQFGDPREIGFFDLRGAVGSAREAGYAALPLELRFYSLLCLPLLLVAMVLISTPISIRFERQGQSSIMIASTVLSGYAVYAMTVIVSALSASGKLSPMLAALVPILIAGGVSTFWLLTAEDG